MWNRIVLVGLSPVIHILQAGDDDDGSNLFPTKHLIAYVVIVNSGSFDAGCSHDVYQEVDAI